MKTSGGNEGKKPAARKIERKGKPTPPSLKEQEALLKHERAKRGLASLEERLGYAMGKAAAECNWATGQKTFPAESILVGLYDLIEKGELDVPTANEIVESLRQKLRERIELLKKDISRGEDIRDPG